MMYTDGKGTPDFYEQVEADKKRRIEIAREAIKDALEKNRCMLIVKAEFVGGMLKQDIQVVSQ
jgi:hypothetical protein